MVYRMEVKKQSQPKKSDKTKKGLHDYARYSNLAFRLIAIVLIGFFGGMKLDQVLDLESRVIVRSTCFDERRRNKILVQICSE